MDFWEQETDTGIIGFMDYRNEASQPQILDREILKSLNPGVFCLSNNPENPVDPQIEPAAEAYAPGAVRHAWIVAGASGFLDSMDFGE